MAIFNTVFEKRKFLTTVFLIVATAYVLPWTSAIAKGIINYSLFGMFNIAWIIAGFGIYLSYLSLERRI